MAMKQDKLSDTQYEVLATIAEYPLSWPTRLRYPRTASEHGGRHATLTSLSRRGFLVWVRSACEVPYLRPADGKVEVSGGSWVATDAGRQLVRKQRALQQVLRIAEMLEGLVLADDGALKPAEEDRLCEAFSRVADVAALNGPRPESLALRLQARRVAARHSGREEAPPREGGRDDDV